MSDVAHHDEGFRGWRIGRYEVLSRLSVGGMAEIFLAMVAGPGGFRKFVTLKRILPQLHEMDEFVHMFLDEARITAGLSHANIAQVFDLGDDDGVPYLAMEFVPGKDLSRLLRATAHRRTRPPMGLAAMVTRDLCHALHYAHHYDTPEGRRQPVIHRDVSPRNVMVTYTGAVKIIDFGIAKAKGNINRTQSGAVKGSIGYMSPEQIRGADIDGRSDLFSAGVVLHELLTGRPLFTAETEDLTLQRILWEDPVSPRGINSEVPEELSGVCMKALQKDAKARFQTGREMAQAIAEAARPLLFDEERAGEYVSELFQESLQHIRELFRRAPTGTAQTLHDAAEAIRIDDAWEDEHTTADRVPTRPSGHRDLAKTATILAVDDSEIARRMLESHFLEAGYHVIGRASAAEALEYLSHDWPDIIVLDVVMPGMDGFELCRRIRERPSPHYAPILFVSSACSLEERLKGLTVGGDDFIRKPYSQEELAGRVSAHLQRAAFLHGVASQQSLRKD